MRISIFIRAGCLTLALLHGFAKAQTWKWAGRLGGDSVETLGWSGSGSTTYGFQDRRQGWNSVVDIATDGQNNSYAVSLVLSKYLEINGTPLSGYGKSDMLLSSFTCDGVHRWSKVIGSNQDSDVVIGVRCDEQGVYLSGMTSSNYASGSTGCHFSTDTVTGSTTRNMFLAEWDLNGKLLWLRMPQPDTISPLSARRSALIDMDATPSGDTTFLFCYLTPGAYAGGLYNVPAAGAYVLKYTANGAFAGGTALPYQLPPSSVSSVYFSRWSYNRPLNQFIVSGVAFPNIGSSLNIGGTQLGNQNSNQWGYLASFDASVGSLKYLVMDTNLRAISLLRKATIDTRGDIYLSGNAIADASFNGVSFPNSLANVIPGHIPYAPFVMKLNGKTGAPLWTCKSQAYSAFGLNVCLRKKELLLTGEYSGTLAFPGASISNNPAVDSGDAFTAYIDTATGALHRLSPLRAKSPTPAIFNTVILDRKGSFICGGGFIDTLVLGNTTLVETHPASGIPAKVKAYDAWIGKLGYANCSCNVSAGYKIVSTYAGTTAFLTYAGSTNIDSLVWSWGDGTGSTYKSSFTNTISHVYAKAGRYQVCVTAYNDTCMDSQYCGTLPLGISGALAEKVRVYPNPATQDLYIEGLGGGSARIVSVTGQIVLETAIRNEKEAIAIGHLPAGYYLIMLRDKEGGAGQRYFVKE